MLTRRLTITPRPGTAHPSGARTFDLQGSGQIAVVRVEADSDVFRARRALDAAGFTGQLLTLFGGQEFTLADVDDGTPSTWQEDGLPSYAALEREVAALRYALGQVAPLVPTAACGPGFTITR